MNAVNTYPPVAVSPINSINDRYWREFNDPYRFPEQRFFEAWGLQPVHPGYQHYVNQRAAPFEYRGPVRPQAANDQFHAWPAFVRCTDFSTCSFPHYSELINVRTSGPLPGGSDKGEPSYEEQHRTGSGLSGCVPCGGVGGYSWGGPYPMGFERPTHLSGVTDTLKKNWPWALVAVGGLSYMVYKSYF